MIFKIIYKFVIQADVVVSAVYLIPCPVFTDYSGKLFLIHTNHRGSENRRKITVYITVIYDRQHTDKTAHLNRTNIAALTLYIDRYSLIFKHLVKYSGGTRYTS